MSKPIFNTFIVKQASSFGVLFLWKNTYIIKPNVIETIRTDDLYYYSVHEEDQSLFDSFVQLFYNTYREVKLHNMPIYVRKETKVGDFVQFGNDTLYLILDEKVNFNKEQDKISKNISFKVPFLRLGESSPIYKMNPYLIYKKQTN